MDEQYREIYESIFRLVVQPEADSPEARLLVDRFGEAAPVFGRAVESALDEAERERGDGARLREDAKALLAVNFRDLVFVPLSAAGHNTAQVEEDVRRDTAMLVLEAAADREQRVPEITGHAVIDALSRNWGGLRISRYNLWERSSPPESGFHPVEVRH